MSARRSRVRCPVCGYKVRVRKNGYLERHLLYVGLGSKRACRGGEIGRAANDQPPYPIYEHPLWGGSVG